MVLGLKSFVPILEKERMPRQNENLNLHPAFHNPSLWSLYQICSLKQRIFSLSSFNSRVEGSLGAIFIFFSALSHYLFVFSGYLVFFCAQTNFNSTKILATDFIFIDVLKDWHYVVECCMAWKSYWKVSKMSIKSIKITISSNIWLFIKHFTSRWNFATFEQFWKFFVGRKKIQDFSSLNI